MFNKQLKQRVENLESIVSDHLNTLIVFEHQLNELSFLKKQNQVLKSGIDELKRKFDVLQSRQVTLMNKVEHIK